MTADARPGQGTVPPLGRDAELAAVDAFLADPDGPACLVLCGEPGVGKTTVWEASLGLARDRGRAVAATRCSLSEARLSFAALADLLDGVDLGTGGVPDPQRRALEVALGRAAPDGPVEPLAIAAGFLAVLRELAGRDPVVVAVDDLQWLDPASAECLTYAARRLRHLPVRFLLCRHPGPPGAVERELGLLGVARLDLGGLGFGAVRELLLRHLGAPLPRRVVRHVVDSSQGNPLFAVELGRALLESGVPSVGSPLPVPGPVEDLLGERARRLPPEVRRALLAVALSAGLRREELAAVVDPLVVEDAVERATLVVDRSVVRPSHPLLAAIVRRDSTALERRELHLDLAGAVVDPTLRVRHLALAAVRPDAVLAGTVSRQAETAARRGDLPLADELAAHALRLTPPGDPAHPDRVLALARYHVLTGGFARTVDLLTERLDALPAGRRRAEAHLLIGECSDLAGEEAHLDLALAEAVDEPALQAVILSRQALLLLLNRVERVAEAEQLVLRAVDLSRTAVPAGTELDPRIAHVLTWARALRGASAEVLATAEAPEVSRYQSSIDRPRAVALAFRGEIVRARTLLERLVHQEEERGEVQFALVLGIQRCELELRAGRVGVAAAHLAELDDLATLDRPLALESRLRAMVAAVTGRADLARTHAHAVLTYDRDVLQAGWDLLEARRALGLAALVDDDAAGAAGHLGQVWDHTRREGVDDPGAFPVAGDLIEAVVLTGDLDRATGLTDRLEVLATAQDHPWGLVTVARGRAAVTLAAGYDTEAVTGLRDAAGRYGALGLEFDAARTLLLLGVLQRRHRKRADARRSLGEARAAFEQLGCTGWAARSAAELDRVSGRRAGGGELTPSERQVVDLAVAGHSNKEIAATLVVTVYTVEAHLSHAYAKLGIRSRTQLAGRLADPVSRSEEPTRP